MPAITASDVRTMLAAQLHLEPTIVADVVTETAVSKLGAFWTPITTRATAKAEAWLRTTLAGFGAQAIAKWPMFGEYQMDLALFWCGVYGAAELTDDQRNLLKELDCRSEVMALESIRDDPDSTADDAVSGGLMRRRDDLFARPSVNSNGSLPGDVFSCANRGYPWSR